MVWISACAVKSSGGLLSNSKSSDGYILELEDLSGETQAKLKDRNGSFLRNQCKVVNSTENCLHIRAFLISTDFACEEDSF